MGYTVDSLGISYGPIKEEIRNKVREGFSFSADDQWIDIQCMIQTELECGPRAVWVVALLCVGRLRHIPLGIIIQKIQSLGNLARHDSARIIRMEVSEMLTNRSCDHIFARVFGNPSV